MRQFYLAVAVAALCRLSSPAAADVFFDDFATGASPLWGNELGNWSATAGVYHAAQPSNSPATYSLLPFALTDFEVELDINAVKDGGVWLRTDSARQNGVLLVTGGAGGTGTGFYWHTLQNGSYSSQLNPSASGLFVSGVSNIHLRITVAGNQYAVYLNGSDTPATTLTTDIRLCGRVGLYDFSSQTFDNVRVTFEPYPLVSAASYRQHGVGNPGFEIPFSPCDPPPIEPRQNGISPILRMTFDEPIEAVDGQASCFDELVITNGLCQDMTIVDNVLTVEVTFNSNACVTFTASGLRVAGGGPAIPTVAVSVLTQTGNVNGTSGVNILDLQVIKNQLNKPLDETNFKADVTCNGTINILDLQATKNNLNQPVACP